MLQHVYKIFETNKSYPSFFVSNFNYNIISIPLKRDTNTLFFSNYTINVSGSKKLFNITFCFFYKNRYFFSKKRYNYVPNILIQHSACWKTRILAKALHNHQI